MLNKKSIIFFKKLFPMENNCIFAVSIRKKKKETDKSIQPSKKQEL